MTMLPLRAPPSWTSPLPAPLSSARGGRPAARRSRRRGRWQRTRHRRRPRLLQGRPGRARTSRPCDALARRPRGRCSWRRCFRKAWPTTTSLPWQTDCESWPHNGRTSILPSSRECLVALYFPYPSTYKSSDMTTGPKASRRKNSLASRSEASRTRGLPKAMRYRLQAQLTAAGDRARRGAVHLPKATGVGGSPWRTTASSKTSSWRHSRTSPCATARKK